MVPSWSSLFKARILDSALVAVAAISNSSNHGLGRYIYINQCREMTDLLRIGFVIYGSRQLNGGFESVCDGIGGNEEGKPSIYVAGSHLNLP